MTTSGAAAPTVALEIVPPSTEPFIRYAASDEDVIAIHQFLLKHAVPAMLCPVAHGKSAREVWRVCNENVGLMAFSGGELVGTLGIMNATWWYGDGEFLTDRWHFLKPDLYHSPINSMLLEEAKKIASEAGMIFIHQGKIRGEKSGIRRMMPRIFSPVSATKSDE